MNPYELTLLSCLVLLLGVMATWLISARVNTRTYSRWNLTALLDNYAPWLYPVSNGGAVRLVTKAARICGVRGSIVPFTSLALIATSLGLVAISSLSLYALSLRANLLRERALNSLGQRWEKDDAWEEQDAWDETVLPENSNLQPQDSIRPVRRTKLKRSSNVVPGSTTQTEPGTAILP